MDTSHFHMPVASEYEISLDFPGANSAPQALNPVTLTGKKTGLSKLEKNHGEEAMVDRLASLGVSRSALCSLR